MKRTRLLESVAFHEAGHAVVASTVGVRLRELSMVEAFRNRGRAPPPPYFRRTIRPPETWEPVPRKRLENMALVCLAGPAAQMRSFPTHYRRSYALADVRQASGLLEYVAPEPRELAAYVGLMEIRARNALSAPGVWHAVEEVAGALMRRVTLRVGDIRTIIDESGSCGTAEGCLTRHVLAADGPTAA